MRLVAILAAGALAAVVLPISASAGNAAPVAAVPEPRSSAQIKCEIWAKNYGVWCQGYVHKPKDAWSDANDVYCDIGYVGSLAWKGSKVYECTSRRYEKPYPRVKFTWRYFG